MINISLDYLYTVTQLNKAQQFSILHRLALTNAPTTIWNLKAELYFSYSSPKWSFSKTLFKPEEIENAAFAFSCGQKPILKTKLSENDAVTINMIFSCLSFTQTQIQNGHGLFSLGAQSYFRLSLQIRLRS